jgi:glycosyltransferase involved in cell wall biosynthesis
LKIIVVASECNLDDYADFVSTLKAFGVEAIITHRLKSSSLSEFAPLYYVPFPKLIKLIKRFAPDLVITDLPYYIPKMAKLTSRKVFYHMLGNAWNELASDKPQYWSILARMYPYYLNAVLNKSFQDIDLVLANSKWLLGIVKEKMPTHPAEVLYTGIDPDKWLPHQKLPFLLKHPAVVGAFDFNVHQKVSGLLKFTRVIRKMPDVSFYFAGNGPYFNLVKQICPPNMFLIGRVPRLEVEKLLESGDIFVHPSGLDVLPRSVKEASLMEKPIIASNVGGIPELVKNNQTGYLCEIDDVNQWIGKIRFLLDNQDVARRFGKNAREFVIETFSWRKMAESFLETLKTFRE